MHFHGHTAFSRPYAHLAFDQTSCEHKYTQEAKERSGRGFPPYHRMEFSHMIDAPSSSAALARNDVTRNIEGISSQKHPRRSPTGVAHSWVTGEVLSRRMMRVHTAPPSRITLEGVRRE